MILKEVEHEREIFGGGDGKAINRHSVRVYKTDDGHTVVLDRTLDAVPPCFEIYGPYLKGFIGITPSTPVDGNRYFGDGWNWPQAVRKMCEVLNATIE